MATATTMHRPGVRAQRGDDLIRAMRSLAIHDNGKSPKRGWASADRIAGLLGIAPGRLAAPLARAEAEGLIQVRRNADGRLAARLTRLAAPRLIVRTAPTILNEIDESPHHDLVKAIAGMPSTSPTIDDLAEHLGRGQDDLCQELVAASALGLVDLWPDSPDGPAVVITPLSAARLGLAISPDYSTWLRIGQPFFGDPDPASVLTESDVTNDNGSSAFDDIADPGDPPEQQVIESERIDARCQTLSSRPFRPAENPALSGNGKSAKSHLARGREERFANVLNGESIDGTDELRIPRPNKFIGFSLAWPVMTPGSNPPRPWTPGDGICPACRGLMLDRRTACLVCLRVGVQDLLDLIQHPAPLPEPIPSADNVRSGGILRGGI